MAVSTERGIGTQTIHLPRWAAKLARPARYKCVFGGRASSKTWTVAHLLIAEAAVRPIRLVCCREFGSTLAVSAKPALEIAIHRMGLSHLFDITNWSIKGRKGTSAEGTFIWFAGLERNREGIRGWEDVDRVWVEEAHRLSTATADILVPTIRKPGSELWFTWNPKDRTDWVWRRFIEHPAEDDITLKVNWRDNPWFTEESDRERLYLKETNPEMYAHVWEGEPADDVGDLKVLPFRLLLDCVDAYRNDLHLGTGGGVEAGLDIADQGGDFNVLVLRRGPVLESIDRWVVPTLGETSRRAAALAEEAGAQRLFYDAGGMGAGVTSYFSEMPDRGFVVRPEIFGGKVKGPHTTYSFRRTNGDFFARRNAQMAWGLRIRANNTRRLLDGEPVDPMACLFINDRIPRLEAALAELAQPIWRESMIGKMELAKRSEDEPSPDIFDAACLAFAQDSMNGLRVR